MFDFSMLFGTTTVMLVIGPAGPKLSQSTVVITPLRDDSDRLYSY